MATAQLYQEEVGFDLSVDGDEDRARTRRMRSWEVVAQVAIDDVRHQAKRALAAHSSSDLSGADEAERRESYREVVRQLDYAASYLNLPATIRTWWLGTRLQGTWGHIHNARIALIELVDTEQLDASRPWIVALSSKYLKEQDHERVAISGDNPSRLMLGQALRVAQERIADEYHRLRRFQISIAIGSLLLLLLVAGLVVLGFLRPGMVPLCFPDPKVPGAEGVTAVCPSGPHSEPASSDVALVVLFGLLGAVLTGVRFVAQSSVASSVPMSTTRSFQALFKAAVGTLAAVLGLLFLRAGVVPGFTQIDTRSQILAYAVVFGAAQEFITRLIDQRSNTLLAGATSTERGPQSTGRP
jgi:hypothetical protein